VRVTAACLQAHFTMGFESLRVSRVEGGRGRPLGSGWALMPNALVESQRTVCTTCCCLLGAAICGGMGWLS
jgi:hypothetical protein